MELDPQAVIDELSKRLHSVTLENVVLTTQMARLVERLNAEIVSNTEAKDEEV
jgi:regulator of replication initiation timing